MTTSWTEYDERSWEYQAGKALAQMKCDGPFKNIKTEFAELYDSEQFDTLARKAMHQANGPGAWTIDDQVSLLASKQHDYGHRNIEKFGQVGVKVRLWDKIARYENLLTREGDASHESLYDTLVDIVGYCAILAMVRNGTFSFPLAAELGDA